MAEGNGNSRTIFSLTNILVTIAISSNAIIWTNIHNIDDKLFKHLTNDEIHCPRSQMVSKAEFDLQSKFSEKQIDDIGRLIDKQLDQLRIEIRNMPLYKDKYSQ